MRAIAELTLEGHLLGCNHRAASSGEAGLLEPPSRPRRADLIGAGVITEQYALCFASGEIDHRAELSSLYSLYYGLAWLACLPRVSRKEAALQVD